MPIIKSAKKRVKTAHKAAVRNSKTKRSLREALKGFGRKPSSTSHSKAQSQLDKAAKKGVIHKNKAARLKSRNAKKAKASGVKPTKATAKSAVKSTAKTTAKSSNKGTSKAKKTTAKKS